MVSFSPEGSLRDSLEPVGLGIGSEGRLRGEERSGRRPSDGEISAIRAHLSRVAWNAYASALDCDSGPLARTGVIWRPIAQDLADRLLSNLLESPKTTLRRDDYAMGYLATIAPSGLETLNGGHEYRETTKVMATLSEFMASIGPVLVEEFGHPFRIASTRQFQLGAQLQAAGRHVDGWPVSIRKMFILPRGVGSKSGTTWFRLRDGRKVTLSSEGPIWAVFENSVVWHAPIFSEEMRPTIEFDFVPARKTSSSPTMRVSMAGIRGFQPRQAFWKRPAWRYRSLPAPARPPAACSRPCSTRTAGRTDNSTSVGRPSGSCGTSRPSGPSLRAVQTSDRGQEACGPWRCRQPCASPVGFEFPPG